MAMKNIDRTSSATRIELGERIRDARVKAGMTGRALAKELGVSHGFISLVETGQSGVSSENMARLSKILGVSFAEWIEDVTNVIRFRGKMTPEGELVDLKTLPANQVSILRAAMSGRKMQVWRLTSDAMGAMFRHGSYLLVDTEARRQIGDIVLAEVDGKPVFRLYCHPVLFSLPANSQPPRPIQVDDDRVVIKGVVDRTELKF